MPPSGLSVFMHGKLAMAALLVLAGCTMAPPPDSDPSPTPTTATGAPATPSSTLPAEYGQEVFELIERSAKCNRSIDLTQSGSPTPIKRGVEGVIKDDKWVSVEPPPQVLEWESRIVASRTFCATTSNQTYRISTKIRLFINPNQSAPTTTITPVAERAYFESYRIRSECANPRESVEELPESLQGRVVQAIETGESSFGADYVNDTVQYSWPSHIEKYSETCWSYQNSTYLIGSFHRVYESPN